MWLQREIILDAKKRGFHIVTNEIISKLSEINDIKVGLLNLFIKHTSASLTINENADLDVRVDFESHFNHTVPENQYFYQHTYEGPDDMPAHLKTIMTNTNLTLSVISNKLVLGNRNKKTKMKFLIFFIKN